MNYLGKLLLLIALLLPGACATVEYDLDVIWLRLIKADLGASCFAERTKVGVVIVGVNGARDEQWFIRTCIGDIEYWVSYRPADVIPAGESSYQVQRVDPKARARPNNSFKPNPLRGSA